MYVFTYTIKACGSIKTIKNIAKLIAYDSTEYHVWYFLVKFLAYVLLQLSNYLLLLILIIFPLFAFDLFLDIHVAKTRRNIILSICILTLWLLYSK